jgi:DtxR family transcriptional regulator, Mn-dependent transcriptional regulator
METLERLTRRQVDALQAVRAGESRDRGASLNGIAGHLRLRPPTALGHLTQLEELGLIARHRGKSRLTDRGRKTLHEYDRHHRIAEGLFDQLGLSAEDTCKAAREVDLALSHRTVERLCEAEGHPTRCPHGEAIPPCRDEPDAG